MTYVYPNGVFAQEEIFNKSNITITIYKKTSSFYEIIVCGELYILFLFLATSGLDSFMASSLVQTLASLAHGSKKRTIIMSIHQPRSDIYKLFDNVMVMGNGKMVRILFIYFVIFIFIYIGVGYLSFF